MSIYLDLPSPFGLPKLSDTFCQPIAAYDPELVIFPSQKHPFYRIGRKVRRSKRQWDAYKKLPAVTSDIRIFLDHGAIALPFALPAKISHGTPEHVIATLRARDMWVHGGPDGDGEKTADQLEANERAEAEASQAAWNAEAKVRKRAMGISYLYATGARVSLVSPRRMVAPPDSPTQTGPPEREPADCSVEKQP